MIRRFLLCCLGTVALAALVVSPLNATIVDDIDPLGSQVALHLSNQGGPASSGQVTIEVTLQNGSTERRRVPFSIGADGETTVTALFASPVQAVIVVGITEGPDPIP